MWTPPFWKALRGIRQPYVKWPVVCLVTVLTVVIIVLGEFGKDWAIESAREWFQENPEATSVTRQWIIEWTPVIGWGLPFVLFFIVLGVIVWWLRRPIRMVPTTEPESPDEVPKTASDRAAEEVAPVTVSTGRPDFSIWTGVAERVFPDKDRPWQEGDQLKFDWHIRIVASAPVTVAGFALRVQDRLVYPIPQPPYHEIGEVHGTADHALSFFLPSWMSGERHDVALLLIIAGKMWDVAHDEIEFPQLPEPQPRKTEQQAAKLAREVELLNAEKELARGDLRLAQANVQWVADSETADVRDREQSLRIIHSQVSLHHIDDRSPYFEIVIRYFCSSIVTFVIGHSVSGHIGWEGQPLSREPELVYSEGERPIRASRGSEPHVRLRQYLNEAEATSIREQRGNNLAEFYMGDLNVSLDAVRRDGAKIIENHKLHLPEFVDQDPVRWIPF